MSDTTPELTDINHLVNHATDAVTDLMDGFVHDAASQAASRANNEGTESQVYFLIGHGWSIPRILSSLNECLSEDEIRDVLGTQEE